MLISAQPRELRTRAMLSITEETEGHGDPEGGTDPVTLRGRTIYRHRELSYSAIPVSQCDHQSHIRPTKKKSILKKKNFCEDFSILYLIIVTECQSPSEN